MLALGYYFYGALAIIGHWWNIWPLNDREAWNYGQFLVMLLGPAILLVSIHILLSDSPSTVRDWRERFQAVSRPLFVSFAAFSGVVTIRYLAVSISPPPAGFYVAMPLFIALFLLAAFVQSSRLHWAVLVVGLVTSSLTFIVNNFEMAR